LFGVISFGLCCLRFVVVPVRAWLYALLLAGTCDLFLSLLSEGFPIDVISLVLMG